MIAFRLLPLVVGLLVGATATSAEIVVTEAVARAASPAAQSGAVYLTLINTGPGEDRLIAVRSQAAARVTLHVTLVDSQGVARMVAVEDGVALPEGATVALAPGGDHVMFMGLTEPWTEGGSVPLVLVFERAGEIAVEAPVAPLRPVSN